MMKIIIPAFAIVGIVIMEMFALSCGHDGLLLAGAISAVSGIGGYSIPGIIQEVKAAKPKS